MLDDFLRDDEDIATFLDELETEGNLFESENESNYGFLGMTAGQRFALSLMLFLLVAVAGAFLLVYTGSIALPVF
jgi:hypothetical protein